MNIVLATFEYPPIVGGVANYLDRLYNGLPLTVHIFSQRAARPYVWWMWPRWYPFYRALRAFIVEKRPDELHISHVLPVGRMAYWIKRSLGIPYVIFFHGTDLLAAHAQPRKWRAVQRIVAQARVCVVNSHATEKLFLQLFPNAQAPVTCAPGVAAPHVIDRGEQISDKPMILFLARLIPRKGLLVALEALHLLVRRAISVMLVVAGDGPERAAAQQYVAHHHLEPYVLFIGSVSDDKKWELFSRAHLFWFPAKEIAGEWEGFGITAREAQSVGCPAIVSNMHGLPETVVDWQTGRVVDATPEAFADATEEILGDAALWQRMRIAARTLVREQSVQAQQKQFMRDVMRRV